MNLRPVTLSLSIALTFAGAGCGLAVSGLMGVPRDEGSSSAPSSDDADGDTSSPSSDPAEAGVLEAGGENSGVVTDVEAGGDAGAGGDADARAAVDAEAGTGVAAERACVPLVVIDDPLTTINAQTWLTTTNMAGYPAVVSAPIAAKPMVALFQPLQGARRGGLWLKTPVPTRAFDVTFEYVLNCPTANYCADGFSAAWVDTTDATKLNVTDGTGGSLGLPTTAGGNMTLTLVKSIGNGADLAPIVLGIRKVDEGAPPGALSGRTVGTESFVRQLQTVSLRVRNGQGSVTINGLTASASTKSSFVGFFGFSAATGDEVDAIYISSFHGKFYDCDPP